MFGPWRAAQHFLCLHLHPLPSFPALHQSLFQPTTAMCSAHVCSTVAQVQYNACKYNIMRAHWWQLLVVCAKHGHQPTLVGGPSELRPNPLHTAHSPPQCGPHCYCTLHTARCTLHTAHCTLHTAHCTLHIAHCTLHTAHCTLHTAHCTLHTIHCTLHSELHTVHTHTNVNALLQHNTSLHCILSDVSDKQIPAE